MPVLEDGVNHNRAFRLDVPRGSGTHPPQAPPPRRGRIPRGPVVRAWDTRRRGGGDRGRDRRCAAVHRAVVHGACTGPRPGRSGGAGRPAGHHRGVARAVAGRRADRRPAVGSLLRLREPVRARRARHRPGVAPAGSSIPMVGSSAPPPGVPDPDPGERPGDRTRRRGHLSALRRRVHRRGRCLSGSVAGSHSRRAVAGGGPTGASPRADTRTTRRWVCDISLCII